MNMANFLKGMCFPKKWRINYEVQNSEEDESS